MTTTKGNNIIYRLQKFGSLTIPKKKKSGLLPITIYPNETLICTS